MKEPLTNLASDLGIWKILSWSIPFLQHRRLLTVFTFHRVTADSDDPRHLSRYDLGTSLDDFRGQLKAIQQIYKIIDLHEFETILNGNEEIHPHTCLLTFDDADSEFYTLVFPILKEHNLPAVVFAPTAYIGTDRVFWHLRVSNAFLHMTEEQWERARKELNFLAKSNNPKLLGSSVGSKEDRMMACQRTVWHLDKATEDDAIAATDALVSFIGCDYTLGIRCMDWEQAAELEANRISIESHTVNHPKLTRIDAQLAHEELKESKSEIERRLKKKVRAICYPGGHFDEKILQLARDSGYRLGFSTRFGFCDLERDDFSPMAIPRFDMRGNGKPSAERFLTSLMVRY